ncbi:hypothetical protein ACFWDA_23245 [Rhodococcus zopfii]|uniref:hypothetical protein n=1 Tax=Rhodococcus zopfii TaxID=43772 RepID=UPI003648755F
MTDEQNTETTGDERSNAARRPTRRKSLDEHIVEMDGIVALAPSARRRSLGAVRLTGAAALILGAAVMAVGFVITTLCLILAPDLLSAVLTEGNDAAPGAGEQTLTYGACAFAVGAGATALGFTVLGAARRRVDTHGALTTADLAAAPKNLADPFRRAVTAAETIRSSVAYRERWMTDVDLDAALWDLAQHVQAGTRLHAELKAAPDGPEYRDEIDRARAAHGECLMHVRGGADRLVGLVQRVEAFDRELSEPARRAELEKSRELRAQRDAERAARLSVVVTEVEAIEPALGGVVDRATGVLDAYDELPKNPSELHG